MMSLILLIIATCLAKVAAAYLAGIAELSESTMKELRLECKDQLHACRNDIIDLIATPHSIRNGFGTCMAKGGCRKEVWENVPQMNADALMDIGSFIHAAAQESPDATCRGAGAFLQSSTTLAQLCSQAAVVSTAIKTIAHSLMPINKSPATLIAAIHGRVCNIGEDDSMRVKVSTTIPCSQHNSLLNLRSVARLYHAIRHAYVRQLFSFHDIT
jgi:hypothetical protein